MHVVKESTNFVQVIEAYMAASVISYLVFFACFGLAFMLTQVCSVKHEKGNNSIKNLREMRIIFTALCLAVFVERLVAQSILALVPDVIRCLRETIVLKQ